MSSITQKKDEFDSEYCNVKYVEKDNVVLLAWKKLCCFDDYRQPTMLAADLLNKHKGSNFSQIAALAIGVLLYVCVTAISYRISANAFERVDL